MTAAANGLDPVVLDYVKSHLGEAAVRGEEASRPLLATATIAARPTAVGRPIPKTRLNAEPVMLATPTPKLARPIFADLKHIAKLPILKFPVLPPATPTTPIQSDDVWLWPDAQARTAYFMLSSPVTVEFDLVVEQHQDFRISGGSATLVVGIFPTAKLPAAIQGWTAALRRAGIDASSWRFEPLNLNRLDAELDLPAGHADGTLDATCNPRLGTAIFLVRLTALGAQVWRQALSGGSPPPGVCELTAWYVGGNAAAPFAARTQSMSVTLAALTGGVGPEAVRTLNPEIGVDATLTVDGDPTVEAITVEMRALNGTVRTETFGSEGGTVTMRMVSENPRAERIDWDARVVFAAASWPPLRVSGTLSDTSGWSDILAPSSWLRAVSLTTMLIGADGNVLTAGADPSNRVSGAVDFTAPFLEGATSLHTGFETSNQESTTVLVPRPPSEPPGTVKLTVFALRDGRDSMLVRNLTPDEQWILVKVYANARIEVLTNRSPGSESTRETATAAIAQAMSALGGG